MTYSLYDKTYVCIDLSTFYYKTYVCIDLSTLYDKTYVCIDLSTFYDKTYVCIDLSTFYDKTYVCIDLSTLYNKTYVCIDLSTLYNKTYVCIDISTLYDKTYVCIDQSTFYRLSICWVELFTIIQDHGYSKACVYIPFQLILNECNQEVYDWVSGQYYHVISHVLQTQSYKFDCWSRVCFIIPIYGSAILTWMHIHVPHNWWKQEHNISKTYSDK